jgi:hypothetical protein
MTDKINNLSESLDKMNSGQIPETADQELADLLEVAALFHNSGLTVRPPEHILSATVQRAVDGLTVQKRPHRTSRIYSGVLGAVAALLMFVGIHGFPSPQEVAPIVAPEPQIVSPILVAEPQPRVLPSQEAASSELHQTLPGNNQITSESSVAPLPQTARQAPPPPSPSQLPSAPTPSQAPSPARSSATSMKSARPPSTEQISPSRLIALRLPDRVPETVSQDAITGIVRQVFDRGTPRELVITQRIASQYEKDAGSQSKPTIAREADNAKSQSFQSINTNTVTIRINGQEVTLEGQQTIQELTELAEKLKTWNP